MGGQQEFANEYIRPKMENKRLPEMYSVTHSMSNLSGPLFWKHRGGGDLRGGGGGGADGGHKWCGYFQTIV